MQKVFEKNIKKKQKIQKQTQKLFNVYITQKTVMLNLVLLLVQLIIELK